MTPKEYLQQYRDAVRRADAAIRHRDELRAMAERITPNYSGSGGGSHQTGDRLGETVAKIIDAEAEIDEKIGLMMATQREVVAVINAVPDARMREILSRRYISGQKFEEIAVTMNYDYRWITRLHGRALQEVQKIIDP